MLTPFNPGSNRIVRERSGTGRSGSPERSIFNWRQQDPVPFGWRQWILRGGDVATITFYDQQGRLGTTFMAHRYIAGIAYDTEDEIYDDDELFNIGDIPIWTRVSALIDLRTFG